MNWSTIILKDIFWEQAVGKFIHIIRGNPDGFQELFRPLMPFFWSTDFVYQKRFGNYITDPQPGTQ